MTGGCPRLVIAGTQSGVGKTSVALGIVRAMARRGLRVQTFKAGPDFLDPTYHAMASGRACYNLDAWMCGKGYARDLFRRAAGDADLAVIEGVMGFYDGADPAASEGSTAELAALIGAPVLLVVNAHGTARSLAATVKGFVEFERDARIAGVVANRCGSARHREWVAESLRSAALPPLVGAVPRQAFPKLESRHLGLVAADRASAPALDLLADACEEHIDLDAALEIARSAPPLAAPAAARENLPKRLRIGIARDRAFHFYYQDNLEEIESRGGELAPFSPLSDDSLPEPLHALYIGGGYPEEHAQALSANRRMLEAVRAFSASGRPVYAECGGLMYLAETVETTAGRRFPLAGVLPVGVRMLDRLKSLGYVEVGLTEDSLWGSGGATLRGHEFHYSEVLGQPAPGAGWRAVYSVRRRRGNVSGAEGYQRGRVLASYIHAHFASRPEAVDCFLKRCEEAT